MDEELREICDFILSRPENPDERNPFLVQIGNVNICHLRDLKRIAARLEAIEQAAREGEQVLSQVGTFLSSGRTDLMTESFRKQAVGDAIDRLRKALG